MPETRSLGDGRIWLADRAVPADAERTPAERRATLRETVERLRERGLTEATAAEIARESGIPAAHTGQSLRALGFRLLRRGVWDIGSPGSHLH